MVFTSLTVQITFWVSIYSNLQFLLSRIIFIILFPLYILISSFFVFYSVNLVYNIFVPQKWIEQNSKYLSFSPPFIIGPNPLEGSGATEAQIVAAIFDPNQSQILDAANMADTADNETRSVSECSGATLSRSTSCASFPQPLSTKGCENQTSQEQTKWLSINWLDELEPDFLTKIPKTILTIEIPVYTEDFTETLVPTFENIKMFIERFNQSANVKANVLIHDDGLQKISQEEQKLRLAYYETFNDCLFIARHPEGRAGKFKKASNLNFGLRQILTNNRKGIGVLERRLAWRRAAEEQRFLYKLSTAHLFEIGNYVLLLDSDSKFNPFSLEALIHEMDINPRIGYLQIRTNSQKIVRNKWENAISHFTNAIYNINFLYSCSNGFPAPLVGHNAILRWSALLEVEELMNGQRTMATNVAIVEDGLLSPHPLPEWKVWDETRVSEDFVMSIYLQYLGYYGKYVFYDCGFKEGVSLNIIDEITKLKKYIYGINEILFYPFAEWTKSGIFTHLFCNFVLSEQIHFSTKYALMAYMGSYYSIALCPFVVCWYYFLHGFGILKGLFGYNNSVFVNQPISTIYICVFIFFVVSILSNVLVKTKHRFTDDNVWQILPKEIGYGLYLTLFYSSISTHLFSMVVVYLLGWKAKWETTKKEAEQLSVLTVIANYRYLYITGTAGLAVVIYGLVSGSDSFFQNRDVYTVVPFVMLWLTHMFFPIYSCVIE